MDKNKWYSVDEIAKAVSKLKSEGCLIVRHDKLMECLPEPRSLTPIGEKTDACLSCVEWREKLLGIVTLCPKCSAFEVGAGIRR